jgi:hypothetical protein
MLVGTSDVCILLPSQLDVGYYVTKFDADSVWECYMKSKVKLKCCYGCSRRDY